METSRNWKEQAREVLLNGALEYVYPSQDIRDLELRAYYAVACLGYIMEAKRENLLGHLKNPMGNFIEEKRKTIEKVRAFLKPRIK